MVWNTIIRDDPDTQPACAQRSRHTLEGVFSQCGVSYVAPTKEGIVKAISECKRNAEQIMGPRGAEVIEHHYSEMMKLVNRLQR